MAVEERCESQVCVALYTSVLVNTYVPQRQCDFRFDLFFSFSFSFASYRNIKPADEDVLMISA